MRKIKSKNMKPEMAVRRLVHGMGYRYRLHRTTLPGKPDLVFGPRKKVIFVHGCFWHQHARKECLDGKLPKSNTNYWTPKLKRNIERDAANLESLKEMGWSTLVIWECECKSVDMLAPRIRAFLSG